MRTFGTVVRLSPARSDLGWIACDAVVGAVGHLGDGTERRAEVVRESQRGHDHGVVPCVAHGDEDREAASLRRAAVGMDVEGDVDVRAVQEQRARRHARTDPGVRGPGEHDPGTERLELAACVVRDVPVELRLGVAAVGCRAGGVAGLRRRAVPDEVVEERGVAPVVAVVAGVEPHDDALRVTQGAACGAVVVVVGGRGRARRRATRRRRTRRRSPTVDDATLRGAGGSRTRLTSECGNPEARSRRSAGALTSVESDHRDRRSGPSRPSQPDPAGQMRSWREATPRTSRPGGRRRPSPGPRDDGVARRAAVGARPPGRRRRLQPRGAVAAVATATKGMPACRHRSDSDSGGAIICPRRRSRQRRSRR